MGGSPSMTFAKGRFSGQCHCIKLFPEILPSSPSPRASWALTRLGTIAELMSGPHNTPAFTIDQRHEVRWISRVVP